MKNEVDGKIIKEFVRLRSKACSYLKYNNNEDEKWKSTKKCVIKTKLEFQDYQNCLEATQFDDKINHLEKSKIDVDSLKEDEN